jgi:Leucine-rich repeat (LRR) protein
MPPGSLLDFDTYIASLPAELIDMIQSFCSHDDLLSLTAVDKTAFATRFCNPRLQKFCFKTVKDTAQFLSYCQAVQDREAEELILEEGKKSRKRLKPALSPDFTTRFLSFTREHLQAIKVLTLTLSAQFTAEQYNLLFAYLSGIQHLTIYSTRESHCALGVSLEAAQHLTLHSLAIFNTHDPNNRRGFNKIVDHLPNELWQFTTLEALTISSFKHIYSISEDIGQLNALKSLTLNRMYSLKALPANFWQLNKLEALTLESLTSITELSEEISQLGALKLLTLQEINLINTLPASLGRLDKLEALNLACLRSITALPEEIGQLNALKSLTLSGMSGLNALPENLWQLNKLETLILGPLCISTPLEKISQLKALNSLTLAGLHFITALPEEIGQLNALKSLELNYLSKLKALPTSIGQLSKLESLTLKDLRSITALPEEMSQLKTLKVFKLVNMALGTLPGKLAQIVIRE